jgi:hypothetical protein
MFFPKCALTATVVRVLVQLGDWFSESDGLSCFSRSTGSRSTRGWVISMTPSTAALMVH